MVQCKDDPGMGWILEHRFTLCDKHDMVQCKGDPGVAQTTFDVLKSVHKKTEDHFGKCISVFN